MRGVKLLRFLAPLFFANAPVLKDRVMSELLAREALPPRLRWRALVRCCSAVSQVDSTAVQVLGECAAECRARGAPLLLASVNAFVERALRSGGLLAQLSGSEGGAGSEAAFLHIRVHDAVRALLQGRVPAVCPAPEEGEGGSPGAGGGGADAARGGDSFSVVVMGRALLTWRW